MITIKDTDTPLEAVSKIVYGTKGNKEDMFSVKDLKDIRDYLTIFLRTMTDPGILKKRFSVFRKTAATSAQIL